MSMFACMALLRLIAGALAFYPVGLRNRTQVIRLGECLYWLSHLKGLLLYFLRQDLSRDLGYPVSAGAGDSDSGPTRVCEALYRQSTLQSQHLHPYL